MCGEETALMASIEGHRGEPRPRPPFPAVKGLFRPTVLNNVETYANIPWIIYHGPEAFAEIGTEKSKEQRYLPWVERLQIPALLRFNGNHSQRGYREIGGGVPNGKKFKAAQTGGPSGGCIPESLLDTPMDFESLAEVGSIMGSGGLIVMDEDNCMVDIAKFFLQFTVDESCGKCVPCRVGMYRLHELLEKITSGNGTLEDIDLIEELCYHIRKTPCAVSDEQHQTRFCQR